MKSEPSVSAEPSATPEPTRATPTSIPTQAPTSAPVSTPTSQQTVVPTSAPATTTVLYRNCAEVREAGKAPLRRGDPGYSPDLDHNGDGVACERGNS
ncbi:MAG TPA: excalibur calcium-binding domain-containing protein [Kribbella sp.]